MTESRSGLEIRLCPPVKRGTQTMIRIGHEKHAPKVLKEVVLSRPHRVKHVKKNLGVVGGKITGYP
jgi:hypothetical protein